MGINDANSLPEKLEDVIWEKLEEALEGPPKLDLNNPKDNVEFQELVGAILNGVLATLASELNRQSR